MFLGSLGRCVMAECIAYIVVFVHINKVWYGKLFVLCLGFVLFAGLVGVGFGVGLW